MGACNELTLRKTSPVSLSSVRRNVEHAGIKVPSSCTGRGFRGGVESANSLISTKV